MPTTAAMPGASQAPRWADLPQDLVQRCTRASILDDIDRLVIMHTCSSWFAAIAAAPELVPDPALGVPALALAADGVATVNHTWHVKTFLSKATRCFALPIHRMRFTGACGPRDLPQESVLLSALALLPTSLRVLELDTRCSGSLLTALARFGRLQEVHITGDGFLIEFAAPGAAALLPKLRSLRLESYDWWQVEWADPNPRDPYDCLSVNDVPIDTLPAGIAAKLAPATALTSLEIHSVWSNDVPALVRSLPALRRLGLEVMQCTSEAAAEAVALLAELPAGTEVALSVHAHWSGKACYNYPNVDYWMDEVPAPLPPMAAIGATVTALDLVGLTCLPADWRHLTGLQTLSLNHVEMEQPFGDEPLTALTALKTVTSQHWFSVLPAASVLASAPALEAVHATDIPDEWRAQLQALRPDVAITDL